MPSSNPRYADPRGRTRVLRIVRSRALAGEPCHICGQPIDLSLPQTYVDPRDGRRKRAPWSLECDELLPVSLGGSPTDESNVAPAHRVCNQRRGNAMPTDAAERPGLRPTREGVTSRRWL